MLHEKLLRRQHIHIKWREPGNKLPFFWQESHLAGPANPRHAQLLAWEQKEQFSEMIKDGQEVVVKVPLDPSLLSPITEWLSINPQAHIFISLDNLEEALNFCQQLLQSFPALKLFLEIEAQNIPALPGLLVPEIQERLLGLWIKYPAESDEQIFPSLQQHFPQRLPGMVIQASSLAQNPGSEAWDQYLEQAIFKLNLIARGFPALIFKHNSQTERSPIDHLIYQGTAGKSNWAKVTFWKEEQPYHSLVAYLFFQDWKYALLLVNPSEEAQELNFSPVFPQTPYGEQYFLEKKGGQTFLKSAIREKKDWFYFPAKSLTLLSSLDFISSQSYQELPEIDTLDLLWDTEILRLKFEIRNYQKLGFKIFDSQGNACFEREPQSLKQGQFELKLDISRLKKGAYILVIRINQKDLIRPFRLSD